jgi:hypothetical protein
VSCILNSPRFNSGKEKLREYRKQKPAGKQYPAGLTVRLRYQY